MKTPDEIKKALKCCNGSIGCNICPYKEDADCNWKKNADALSYIQQLEAQNAELKRELGKAVMALATCAMDGLDGNICNYCTRKNCDEQDLHFECFEWRGLCEENGGKKSENEVDQHCRGY